MPRINISFDDCVLDNLSEDVRQKMLNLLRKYAIVENPDELQAWCTTSTDGSSESGEEVELQMFTEAEEQSSDP